MRRDELIRNELIRREREVEWEDGKIRCARYNKRYKDIRNK